MKDKKNVSALTLPEICRDNGRLYEHEHKCLLTESLSLLSARLVDVENPCENRSTDVIAYTANNNVVCYALKCKPYKVKE